ncbi:MAG: RNA methyltransferase [Magnetococcales bacterium]|nr:RNA methyltransferase [Magnetococcales bacterium]
MIRLAKVPAILEEPISLAPGMEGVLARWQPHPGDILTVVDPAGGLYRARFLGSGQGVRPFAALPGSVEPRHRRRLAQALPDRERMLWVVQKSVELGVTEIQPVVSARSCRMSGEDAPRQDKSMTWPRIIRKAAMQCRRATIPEIHAPVPLAQIPQTVLSGELLLFMDVAGQRQSLFALAPDLADTPLTLLVGPEGGWSDQERDLIHASGGLAISLGSRVLRTETAGMAALAVIAAAEGTFTPGADL